MRGYGGELVEVTAVHFPEDCVHLGDVFVYEAQWSHWNKEIRKTDGGSVFPEARSAFRNKGTDHFILRFTLQW